MYKTELKKSILASVFSLILLASFQNVEAQTSSLISLEEVKAKALDKNKKLENDFRALKYVDIQNKKLNEEVLDLREKLSKTEAVLFEVNNKYNGLKQQHESLEQNYNAMLQRNKNLLEKAFGKLY